MKLWYDKPARNWVEALPLGNGRIGAMVFGGVATERFALNEDTLWSGPPPDWNNPAALDVLPEARRAALEGRYEEAEALCKQMQGSYGQSYLPMGDLLLDFEGAGDEVSAYRRDLDLDSAISTVTYRIGNTVLTREAFISAPDQVMVVRITTDTPGTISFTARLQSPIHHNVEADVANRSLTLTGRGPVHAAPSYIQSADPIVYAENKGIPFAVRLHVATEGGVVESASDEAVLRIRGASSVVLFLSAATGFVDYCHADGHDPLVQAQESLENAKQQDYETLRERHVADHRSLYRRVALDLGGNNDEASLSTDSRIRRFGDSNDPALAALLFQYGRYLLITSSRPGTQPANLQGIWNQELRPPWSSNYTLNINAEMNYWPAEVANLSECHLPLLDFIQELAVNGAKTARTNYGCNGWTAHHNSDIWRQSAPVGEGSGSPSWANWPMGGAWLCQHLWEHYAFTGDREFLSKVWPVLRGAAEFGMDWLVEGERGHLVTAPSTSPEHGFITPDGQRSAVSVATTMDMAILRDLFTNSIRVVNTLGIEPEFAARLRETVERLFPMQVGSHGQLLEFYREFTDQDEHHRHVSHLYGLFPGRDLTPDSTPELCAAARRSLEIRGDAGTGWSLGWKINLWARLRDGDHAYRLVQALLTLVEVDGINYHGGGGVYANLFDAHPPFQIDGNFAFTAGVCEMLVQSHQGEIHLLPALPPVWHTGSVTGLRARGGFEVSMNWRNGALVEATIHSLQGDLCTVRYGEERAALAIPEGQTVVWKPDIPIES